MDKKFFEKFDITLFLSVTALIIIGIFAIYSATQSSTLASDYYLKQSIFAVIGLIIAVIVMYIPPRYISSMTIYLYILSVILLILVLVFGKTINGNKSWFYIAGFGIQPSEFAKVATVLAIANFFYRSNEETPKIRFKDILISSVFVIIPVLLVKLENDTGTTLVMLSFIIPMYFWAGVSPFFLFGLVTPIFAAIIAFIDIRLFYVYLAVVFFSMLFFPPLSFSDFSKGSGM